MPNGVGKCGIGSSMNSQGECIGTGYGDLQPLANVAQGVDAQPVVGGVVSFGAVIATVLFAAFAVAVVAGVLRSRVERNARRAAVDAAAADRLKRDYYRRFDMADFGRRVHEAEADRDADAEDDTEDDSPNDDAVFWEERP